MAGLEENALRAPGKTFRDIVVNPSVEVIQNPGALFRGGPVWPNFEVQITARHCWFPVPLPIDAKPVPACHVSEFGPEGVWCGPISFHFGHMVADFGMRLAASGRAYPELPLLFSIWDVPCAAPLPFFWEIVDHLGIARERIRLVGKPARWERLHVLPQAERRFGGGPSRSHLALMDRIAGAGPEADLGHVFVSRAGLAKGRFAGEGVLEAALAQAGVTVFRPETAPLRVQLETYRRARHLIFSEGSALHALQLLGHLDAEITVLGRRPRRRMAAAALRPRARALRYPDILRGLVHGLRASGRPQRPTGISILDEDQLLDRLGEIGLDLRRFWDGNAYRRARDDDIAAWIDHRLAGASHAGEPATIDRCLRRLAL